MNYEEPEFLEISNGELYSDTYETFAEFSAWELLPEEQLFLSDSFLY